MAPAYGRKGSITDDTQMTLFTAEGLFWPMIGSDAAVFELGKKTAALTHGHPSGMLSAGHFALMIAALSRGEPLRSAVEIACAELGKHEAHEEVMDSVRSAVRLADS